MVADPAATTRPVLDFQELSTGMIIGGDYWYFKGFDVTRSANAQKGIQVSGNHNTLDQINAYHNGNTGIQISRLNSTDEYENWPSYNLSELLRINPNHHQRCDVLYNHQIRFRHLL